MSIGVLRKMAPELRVPTWIDGSGEKRAPLKLSEMGSGYKVLYCFQHWCPGCHSRGFPTLKRMVKELSAKGVGFAAIQTVFEGAEHNTFEKLRANQEHHNLQIPFGHDPSPAGERYPTVMADYCTAGTPWFIVIDPEGRVVYNNFQLDLTRFIAALERETVSLEG